MALGFQIFSISTYDNDRLEIAKLFFDKFTSGFTEALKCISSGVGYLDEYNGCYFSDQIEPEEEPFEGVKFFRMEDELVISMEEFEDLLRDACHRYIKRYPECEEEIKNILKENGKDYLL